LTAAKSTGTCLLSLKTVKPSIHSERFVGLNYFSMLGAMLNIKDNATFT